ncbi:MAG: hypothetical protein OMM_11495, partial [Candidatus Magnetoglobus multicellularis str. Araruama]
MIAHMTKVLDNNLEEALEIECQGINYGYYDWDIMYTTDINFAQPLSLAVPAPPSLSDPPDFVGSATEDNGANEFSETNNQVAGVDEADFIKNDGAYIYILADNKFKIIDAWPPENASVISQFDIQGTPKKLFVHNNRAVIYSSLNNLKINNNLSNEECTYGYSCEFTGDGKQLKITILDISDKRDPQLVRELFFNGSYINSRRIDNAVYSVILFPEPSIRGVYYDPGLSYCESDFTCNYSHDFFCDDWWCRRCYWYSYKRYTDQEIIDAFESLKQKNILRIMSADLSSFRPTVRDVRYIDGQVIEEETPISELDEIHFSGQQDGMNFISIFSFDIDDIESRQSVSVVGKPGAVYASSTACYIASRHDKDPYLPWWFSFRFWESADQVTTIHKFNLKKNPAQSFYAGSGAVKGRVLNQFAMDEHKGFLRIATTSGYTPSPLAHSILTVLEESISGDLVPVGKIDNIAPSEDIRSVRFNRDKGFIVTFKKTDPLFAIDLSNPYSPS